MLREEKADKNFKVINRQRYNFVHNDLHYAIDIYDNILGREKTYILRFANPKQLDPKSLVPDFIKAIEEVRLNRQYSLKSIAKLEWSMIVWM